MFVGLQSFQVRYHRIARGAVEGITQAVRVCSPVRQKAGPTKKRNISTIPASLIIESSDRVAHEGGWDIARFFLLRKHGYRESSSTCRPAVVSHSGRRRRCLPTLEYLCVYSMLRLRFVVRLMCRKVNDL